jgi:SAM-dependent methyltransferase
MWDQEAPRFDETPDHGLRDPLVRSAWLALLRDLLPPPPLDVVDLGCGTGSLSVLLAEDGHHVRGLDVSPGMLRIASGKAAISGVAVGFVRSDVSDPKLDAASVDVVLARHVVWALPDPEAALEKWLTALRPGGRLVLIEGKWATGAGVVRERLVSLLPPAPLHLDVRALDTRCSGAERSTTSATSSSPASTPPHERLCACAVSGG